MYPTLMICLYIILYNVHVQHSNINHRILAYYIGIHGEVCPEYIKIIDVVYYIL